MLDRILARREFTGTHMLVIMVLFFGTIVTVNVTMARFAFSSWTGLVVENSYVASQHFNEDVADRRRQASLGYVLAAAYSNETVNVDLTRSDRPLGIVAIEGTVGRPATAMEDSALDFVLTGKGVAKAAMQLAPGLWQADVTVTSSDGEDFARSLRFTVTPEEAESVR